MTCLSAPCGAEGAVRSLSSARCFHSWLSASLLAPSGALPSPDSPEPLPGPRLAWRPGRTASTSPNAPRLLAPVGSHYCHRVPLPHPGGTSPWPQCGQVPYRRVNSTACPPLLFNHRLCIPRLSSGVPHCSHRGRSSSGNSFQSACALIPASSSTIPARSLAWWSSPASSISRHVALGCCCFHSFIPLKLSLASLISWLGSLPAHTFLLLWMLSPVSHLFLSAKICTAPFLFPGLSNSKKVRRKEESER